MRTLDLNQIQRKLENKIINKNIKLSYSSLMTDLFSEKIQDDQLVVSSSISQYTQIIILYHYLYNDQRFGTFGTISSYWDDMLDSIVSLSDRFSLPLNDLLDAKLKDLDLIKYTDGVDEFKIKILPYKRRDNLNTLLDEYK